MTEARATHAGTVLQKGALKMRIYDKESHLLFPKAQLSLLVLLGAMLCSSCDKGDSQGGASGDSGPGKQVSWSLKASEGDQAWLEAEAQKTASAYREFLGRYPSHPKADEAKRRIEELAWTKAREEDAWDAYSEFLSLFPSSGHQEDARTRMDRARWDIRLVEYDQIVVDDPKEAKRTGVVLDVYRRGDSATADLAESGAVSVELASGERRNPECVGVIALGKNVVGEMVGPVIIGDIVFGKRTYAFKSPAAAAMKLGGMDVNLLSGNLTIGDKGPYVDDGAVAQVLFLPLPNDFRPVGQNGLPWVRRKALDPPVTRQGCPVGVTTLQDQEYKGSIRFVFSPETGVRMFYAFKCPNDAVSSVHALGRELNPKRAIVPSGSDFVELGNQREIKN
jgi:hypothetical protein